MICSVLVGMDYGGVVVFGGAREQLTWIRLDSVPQLQTYLDNTHWMRVSNDREESDPMNLGLLGVVDLDFSLSPDVFVLRAFDDKLPLTRMLPGSSPCELRLLLPDFRIGTDGFHDVVIENLSVSPTWRSSHVAPADVTALRRR